MTSPSETPLDLDHVKALADMRAAARSARSELAKGSTNDHQRPGERFPSHERAAQVLEGDARAEDAQEGRP